MFSGIIQHIAKPIKFEKNQNSIELYFPIPKDWKLVLGESVNIDGVCSTVKSLDKKTFSVYYMPETIKKTSLSTLSSTHLFNVERSLTLQDLIGGHLVSGHVDTTAKVLKIEDVSDSYTITFSLSQKFTKYLIYKGSITVNGVSLTVTEVLKNSFSVSLIPYTLEHTNLGNLNVGDSVNIEVDMVAKYIEKLFKK